MLQIEVDHDKKEQNTVDENIIGACKIINNFNKQYQTFLYCSLSQLYILLVHCWCKIFASFLHRNRTFSLRKKISFINFFLSPLRARKSYSYRNQNVKIMSNYYIKCNREKPNILRRIAPKTISRFVCTKYFLYFLLN